MSFDSRYMMQYHSIAMLWDMMVRLKIISQDHNVRVHFNELMGYTHKRIKL